MVDLSHWDFAEQFSGYDAAALILGMEPRQSDTEQWRVNVVVDRMAQHYQHAITRFEWEILIDVLEEKLEGKPVSKIELVSVKMDELHHQCWLNGADAPFSDWLMDRRQPRFENQEFGRHSIAMWLTAIGMKSVYQFDRRDPPAIDAPSGRWPWGNHHTELLGHLEAAAKRYWVNYNPDDATTAPTNKDVSEWLVSERNVSQKMAESIASILRPDGLPTGPRK